MNILCGEVLQLAWSNNVNHSFLAQVVVPGLGTKILALALIPHYKEEMIAVIICAYRQELMIAVCTVPASMRSDPAGLWHSLQSHHGPVQSPQFCRVWLMYETKGFILD